MIVAVVIVSPIAILLPVCLIVFLIETDAVAEREAIVGRHQVHRRRWPFAIASKEIAGGREALRKVTEGDVLLQPETTGNIAKMVIPFGEQRWEISHLIAARADIPGFRNQFHLRQHAVAADSLEQRRILAEFRRPPHH